MMKAVDEKIIAGDLVHRMLYPVEAYAFNPLEKLERLVPKKQRVSVIQILRLINMSSVFVD